MPTTSITGTTDVEDTFMRSNISHNYGGQTYIRCQSPGGTTSRASLVRIATPSAIPAGTITALSLEFYATGTAVGTPVLEAFAVTDACDWVEGTGSTTLIAGTVGWKHLAYDSSSPTFWPGSGGGSTSGTDFTADASPPTFGGKATGLEPFDLGAAGVTWATDWRDANRDPNGIRLHYSSATSRDWYSTESGTTPLSFDVDYTAAASGNPWYIYARRQ